MCETQALTLLFALVPVLAQSLFTLVGGHLVSLFLLSAWHSFTCFYKLIIIFTLFGCKDSANRVKKQILFDFFREAAYLRVSEGTQRYE